MKLPLLISAPSATNTRTSNENLINDNLSKTLHHRSGIFAAQSLGAIALATEHGSCECKLNEESGFCEIDSNHCDNGYNPVCSVADGRCLCDCMLGIE